MLDTVEAEDSENNRAQERGHRKAKVSVKGQGRRVKFDEVFPIHEVDRADPEERTFRMDDPLGWAVLDSGAAKSFAGGELAAM